MIVRASNPIITPTCPKCGRLRREYARMNRRRLGIWGLHRLCCCGDDPGIPNCVCCTGNAPLVYEAVVSGVNECSTCLDLAGNDVSFEWLEDPNRTWTLTNTGGLCRWVSPVLENAVRRRVWFSSNGTCSNFAIQDDTLGWQAIFDISANAGFLIDDDLSLTSPFEGTDDCDPKIDCMTTPFVIANDLNCGVESSGTMGSVTITPA